MSTSTAPAVKTALKALFDGVTDDSTNVWRVANPNVEYPLGENVYIGDILKGHREFKNVGRGAESSRQENYIVEVEVAVARKGTNGEATEDRCWEITEALEAAIAGDVKLGNLQGLTYALAEGFDQTSHAGSDGWLCVGKIDVAVEARI